MTLLDTIRGAVGQPTIQTTRTQEFLRDAADMGSHRIEGYRLYEEYYDGDQRYPLTDRQRRYLQRSGLPYVENFCETIVDAHSGRQTVTGFSCDNATAEAWLSDLFDRNAAADEEPIQDVVHHETYVLGDAFALVEPDFEADTVRGARQNPHRIKPVYCDGQLEYVVKVWDSSAKGPLNPNGVAVRRMNLFFDDRIEKYYAVTQGDNATWAPWLDPDDEQAVYELGDDGSEITDAEGDPIPVYDQGVPVTVALWPTPWTMDGTPEGEPIGIPVVHFKRKAKGRDFGRSKLRGVIPQQDALMKVLLDLSNVLDHAFPVNYATGVASDQAALTLNSGEWTKFTGDNVKVGQLPAADPTPIVTTYEATIRRIGARAATPVHILLPGVTMPSGESLKTAESPMTAALEDEQGPLGNAWSRYALLTHRVATAFGLGSPPALPADTVIETLWKPVESRNEESQVIVAEGKGRIGVSKHTLIRELGYDPEEEAKHSAEEAQASLTAAQAAFNAGNGPPPTPADGLNNLNASNGQK